MSNEPFFPFEDPPKTVSPKKNKSPSVLEKKLSTDAGRNFYKFLKQLQKSAPWSSDWCQRVAALAMPTIIKWDIWVENYCDSGRRSRLKLEEMKYCIDLLDIKDAAKSISRASLLFEIISNEMQNSPNSKDSDVCEKMMDKICTNATESQIFHYLRKIKEDIFFDYLVSKIEDGSNPLPIYNSELVFYHSEKSLIIRILTCALLETISINSEYFRANISSNNSSHQAQQTTTKDQVNFRLCKYCKKALSPLVSLKKEYCNDICKNAFNNPLRDSEKRKVATKKKRGYKINKKMNASK